MKDKLMQVASLVAVVALLVGGFGGYNYAKTQEKPVVNELAVVQNSAYQAVFLSNGSMYFGKLSGEGTTHPVLREVYYFQAGQEQVKNAQPKLIKFGSEIQGPKDELRLNPSQIMYVQDLTDEGQVVKAIKSYTK